MKRTFLLMALVVTVMASASCTKPDYKKLVNDFILATTSVRDFEIREIADTKSDKWKAVIVYTKQGASKMPVPFFVSTDGKVIVPNAMV